MADHIIDASGKRLGRLATDIARILQDKHKPSFTPSEEGTDRVLLKNAGKVTISGSKEKTKVYYRHTGYMGHLKEETYEAAFAKSPENVIREAVRRMLPKNFLNARRLKRLVFINNE